MLILIEKQHEKSKNFSSEARWKGRDYRDKSWWFFYTLKLFISFQEEKELKIQRKLTKLEMKNKNCISIIQPTFKSPF